MKVCMCDCCNAKYCEHEYSEYPGICRECAVNEKYKTPLRMLLRMLLTRDIGILSDYEFFEIHYSGLLNSSCARDPLLQCFFRICQAKFEDN